MEGVLSLKVIAIRLSVVILFFLLSFYAMADLGATLVDSLSMCVILTSPLVLVLFMRIRMRDLLALILDATALGYASVIVLVYLNFRYSNTTDGQGAIAFILFPLYAIAAIGIEWAVLQHYKQKKTEEKQL